MPGIRPKHASPGFTLVEILIVVIILGILAAIVVTAFGDITGDARRSVFISNMVTYRDAAFVYISSNGEYPEDTSSGDCPSGFDVLIDCDEWEGGTPIGGVWDFEFEDTGGYTSAFGVHFNGEGVTQDDAYMTRIDETIDDGDLADGAFRKIADDRYYYIVEE